MEWKLFLDQFSSDRIGMYFDIGNCLIYPTSSSPTRPWRRSPSPS